MNEITIHYELSDDGGSNARYWEILLPVGTTFKHEYGTYKVSEHMRVDGGGLIVMCDRISKDSLS